MIDVVPSVDEFHARTACGGRAVDARSGDFEGYSHALQTDSPGQLNWGTSLQRLAIGLVASLNQGQPLHSQDH